MSRPKINIRIRSKIDSANRLKIEIKEKSIYLCKNCSNRYYALTMFCPECLAEMSPNQAHPGSLKIISTQNAQEGAVVALLQQISGQKDFDFAKALRALPWTVMENTDAGVLQHWKEILDAEQVEAELTEGAPAKSRKRRGSMPLFGANAPLPMLLRPSVVTAVRSIGKKIGDPALRMKWNEAVLSAWNLLELFYKREPVNRILFPDFLFQIDHLLHEAARDYPAKFKGNESAFSERIANLKQSLEQMESEIQAVKKQVEEQL